MTPEPPDDDKCQVSMCHQTHFTYCPHCKLFVCIEHLNQHYSNYKQEYQSLLNDGKQQQILNKQFIDDIETEKNKLIEFFNSEIQYYQTNDKYFHEKAIQITVRPQDCADLRLHILQSSQKRLKFKKFIHQIQQLINDCEYHQPNGFDNETSSPLVQVKSEEFIARPRISKTSPLAQFSIDYEEIEDDDDEDGNEQQQQHNADSHSSNNKEEKSNIPNGRKQNLTKIGKTHTTTSSNNENLDESLQSDDESDEEDETDNDHIGSDPDFGNDRRISSTKIRHKKEVASSRRPAVNHFQVTLCPLTKNLYGIDINKHHLRHVPCTRSNISSIYLFTHLRVFHCLNSKASLRLVRHIMFHGGERDCDLFSQSQESLVNILPKSYRGRCPLTKLGAFGLNKYHDIRLCDETQTNEDTGLLNHLVVYHCLSYPWANKLCNAVQAGDCDGSKHILFKPNEPIKAKKWLTTQGKLILAKRYSAVQKRKKVLNKKPKK